MKKELYYEDFRAGQQLKSSGSHKITKESSFAFSREYDPQLQHIDEEAAKHTLLRKLTVSGWQTAAVTMKLKTKTPLFDVAGGLVGLGIEAMRWPRPTLPEDTLRIVVTILDKRLSASKPDKGIVRYKAETFNQHDELVLDMVAAVIVPRRNPYDTPSAS